jgi:hypothetical protein
LDVQGRTHTIDDSGAIQNALNVGQHVMLPAYIYRVSRSITVPPGSALEGEWASGAAEGSGTILSFDDSVATCVTVGANVVGSTRTAGLKSVIIEHPDASFAPSTGVLVEGVFQAALEYVTVQRVSVGFRILETSDTGGVGLHAYHLQTAYTPDAAMVIDGWPEVYVSDSRFGASGDPHTSNTYLRIQGGSLSNVAAGPNTIYFVNSQFNSDGNTTNWIQFVNYPANGVSIHGEFSFVNVHVEGVSGAYVHSDRSWKKIEDFRVANSRINTITEFWDLNAATTSVYDLHLDNNVIAGSFTLPATAAVQGSSITGNRFGSAVSVAAAQSLTFTGNYVNARASLAGNGRLCTLASANNIFAAGLTLAGTCQYISSVDTIYNGGLNDSSTAAAKFLSESGRLLYLTGMFKAGGATIGPADGGVALTVDGSIVSGGPTFTISSGCKATGLIGGATAGKFTASTSSCNPVVALPPAPNGWSCRMNDETTAASFQETVSTTRSATFIGSNVAAREVIDFFCLGF